MNQADIRKFEVFTALGRVLVGDYEPKCDVKLKSMEYKALLHLKYEEGKPMNYYSQELDLENGSFTYLADKLERKGLIERQFVEGDRRKKVLVLTEDGQKLANQLAGDIMKHIANKLEVLEHEDKEMLLQVIANLEVIKDKLIKAQR